MKYNTKVKIKLVLKINNVKRRVLECFKLGISQSTYYYELKKINETGTISNKSIRHHNIPRLLGNIEIII